MKTKYKYLNKEHNDEIKYAYYDTFYWLYEDDDEYYEKESDWYRYRDQY